MKRYTLFILCIIGLLWFIFKASKTTVPMLTTLPNIPSILPSERNVAEPLNYIVNGETFSFSWFAVDQTDSIKLIPNFTKQTSSISVAQENKCTFLSSAGFYSTDSKPIGLFVIDNKQLSPYQPNALLNGFLSVNSMGIASIETKPPPGTSTIVLQSGPLLIVGGLPQQLAIRNDEPARRIVVVETSNHKIVFLVLYSLENTFEGPKLTDVPNHLKEIEKNIHISIIHALNLDGGSASAFITPTVSITELTPVGSFFCIQ